MNSARWAKRRKSSASRNHQPGGTAMPRRIDEGRTSRRTGDDSRLVKDRTAAGGGFNQATIVAGSGGMPGVAGRTVVAPSDRRGKKRNVGRNTPRPRWEAFLPSELLVRSLGRNYFYPTGRGSSSWWNSFFVIPKLANTSRDHFFRHFLPVSPTTPHTLTPAPPRSVSHFVESPPGRGPRFLPSSERHVRHLRARWLTNTLATSFSFRPRCLRGV